MKKVSKKEVEKMNEMSIRESLHGDLSTVLSKYTGVENTEENRIKLRADIIKTIYGGGKQ